MTYNDSDFLKNEIKTVENQLLGEKYIRAKHKSGLEIVLSPKDIKVSYVLLGVRFGSADCAFYDGEGVFRTLPDGTAHFMEHKMFENTDGSDAFERFVALGAEANAYTTHNKTAYLFNCSENFGECLRELLSFVTEPSFKEASIEKERGIIGQEILMYDDNPYNRSFELLLNAMYEKNPVRRKVCGTVESINDITADVLYGCWNNFYCTSNMVLSVCGNVSLEDILSACDEILSDDSLAAVNKPATVDKTLFEEGRVVGTPLVEIELPVSRPLLCLGYKLYDDETDPSQRQKNELALMIINEILFSHSGDLYNSLYSNGRISSWFSSSLAYTKRFSNLILSTEADDPKAVFAAVRDYINKVREDGIAKEDFERCRRVIYSEFIAEFDSGEEISELMLECALNGEEPYGFVDNISEVTYELVSEIFEKSFTDECLASVVIYPVGTVSDEA